MATKKTAGSTSRSPSKTASKGTAKKSPAKKSPAKKTTARKSTAKKSEAGTSNREQSDRDASSRDTNRDTSRASAPRAAAGKRRPGPAIAASAAQQLLELTGRDIEGVTGLERTDDGWLVEVEVVEVRRIPDTTDVLALYELTVDADGDLEGYRRVRRYGRGAPGRERD